MEKRDAAFLQFPSDLIPVQNQNRSNLQNDLLCSSICLAVNRSLGWLSIRVKREGHQDSQLARFNPLDARLEQEQQRSEYFLPLDPDVRYMLTEELGHCACVFLIVCGVLVNALGE